MSELIKCRKFETLVGVPKVTSLYNYIGYAF